MTTSAALSVGVLIGLLFAAVLMLATLTRYVSSDMDGFRRWLDRREL